MNGEEARRAVSESAWVGLRGANGKPLGVEGKVLAYCSEPQVLIETDDGERAWWRADLAERSDRDRDR